MQAIIDDPILAGSLGIMALTLISMVFIPIIPGQVIVWLTAIGFGLLAGWSSLGWGTFLWLTALMLLAILLDAVAGWLGAKKGGASWKAIIIGLVSALIGMVILNLPGSFLGAILGIAIYEYRKNGNWKVSFKAAIGYVAGWLTAFIMRFGITFIMVLIFATRQL